MIGVGGGSGLQRQHAHGAYASSPNKNGLGKVAKHSLAPAGGTVPLIFCEIELPKTPVYSTGLLQRVEQGLVGHRWGTLTLETDHF